MGLVRFYALYRVVFDGILLHIHIQYPLTPGQPDHFIIIVTVRALLFDVAVFNKIFDGLHFEYKRSALGFYKRNDGCLFHDDQICIIKFSPLKSIDVHICE